MIKRGLFILFLFLSVQSFSQSLDSVNFWFDRYEYKKAAVGFQKIPSGLLEREDYLRWCYASFVSHDYKSCYQISDSLIRTGEVPAFFYYANAFSAMTLSEFEKAKAGYEIYKTLDDEFFVDSLIVSCEQILEWNPEEYVKFISFYENPTKANISGMYSKGDVLFFQEGGIDFQKKQVDDNTLESAELLFMNPYRYSLKSNQVHRIVLPDEYTNNNIVSLTIDSTKNEAYFTMSIPLSDNPLMSVPRIYTGAYNNDTLTNVRLWRYSGIEDSSSTAYATISPSAQHLVFTKQYYNKETSDLYISTKIGNEWSEPVLIQGLKSNGDDAFPLFIDDTTLSFASNGRVGYGGFDIYLSSFHNGVFNNIHHLKSPINSFSDDFNFFYTPKKDTAFFTSNRNHELNDDNIYIVQLLEEKPIPEGPEQLEDLYIYFDFDHSVVKSTELDKIVKHDFTVLYNIDYAITIESYCDDRGTNAYNDVLGQKRADAVKEKLIKLGLNEDNITIVSKGKREPLVSCIKCSEEEHSKNRVVIVKTNITNYSL